MVKRAGGALLLSVRIDHASPRPVSTQLYVHLRDLILSGGFGSGERLPASRTLARDLSVSRTTVIEAFDRLTAEGLIESRVGAGTYVSKALSVARPKPPAGDAAASAKPPRLSRAMARSVERFGERQRLPSAPRAFTTALPAFDAFPMAQWARLSAKHWRRNRDDVLGYGEPFGYPPLRQAIAAHLRANRGIGCDAEQIFIVGGAQQAFSLVGSVLLNPGDPVWFENPGAIGARNSLIAAGGELVPVPVDDAGHARRRRPAAQPALPPRVRHAVAPAAAVRGDEPRAALRAAARRREGRRVDHRGRLRRRVLVRRHAAADAQERGCHGARHLRRARSASRCSRRCGWATCSPRPTSSTRCARS